MKQHTLRLAAFRLAFTFTLGVILWLATASTESVAEIPTWDKLNHAAAFAVLAFLLDYCAPNRAPVLAGANAWKWLTLLGIGLGIEGAQWYLGSRVPEVHDAIADVVGMACYLIVRKPARRLRLLDEMSHLGTRD